MNEVLRNVTELKIQGQHRILGNPSEDEKFSWFSHRVISDVLSEPNYFKSIHSFPSLPNANLRFTCTFWELINDINDHGSKANPRQLFRCFQNSSSVGGENCSAVWGWGTCGLVCWAWSSVIGQNRTHLCAWLIHLVTKAFPIRDAGTLLIYRKPPSKGYSALSRPCLFERPVFTHTHTQHFYAIVQQWLLVRIVIWGSFKTSNVQAIISRILI